MVAEPAAAAFADAILRISDPISTDLPSRAAASSAVIASLTVATPSVYPLTVRSLASAVRSSAWKIFASEVSI